MNVMTLHALRSRIARRAIAVLLLGTVLLLGAVLLLGTTGFGIAGALAASTPAETPGSAPAGTAAGAGSSVLPVLGRTTITEGRDVTGTRATALVHGVRRIPGGTVLYFSVGLPAGSEKVGWTGLSRLSQARRYQLVGASILGGQFLVDMSAKQVYSVLVDADRKALASPTKAWTGSEPGQFYVLYQVLPELPADRTAVDVQIGNGDVVPDVPIADGLLEPAVEQTAPLPLGQGWPKIDLAAVAASLEPEKSVHDLRVVTSDLEQTVVKRESKRSVSVDLAADVLFAVDSATLTPAAKAKVAAAAEQINSRAADRRIQVIGHTDNTGSTAHNNDLSRRRAQAVAAALRPLVTVPGATFVIEGHGEREPVADNGTASGRKENRRVSVVFTPEEGK
jgi:outer membrane protein OmpA-like peptidoglycan-associated protein